MNRVTEKKIETKSNWVCPNCLNKTSKKGITTPSRSEVPYREEASKSDGHPSTPCVLPTGSSDELHILTSEIKLLRGDVGDLKTHIKYLTEHLTQCYTRLDEYDARMKKLEKREEEIISLNNTIHNLREQLNSQAQSSLRNELEISGINEHKNENPLHIVQIMAHKIGVAVGDQDVDFVTRAGPRRKVPNETTDTQPRSLVVRFVRRYKRDEFLKAAKVRRNMTSGDLELAGPSRNIYCNERLTHGNRQLFRATKISAKERGYKFCWHKNGTILIRRNEGHPSIQIRNSEDLERYLGTPTQELEQTHPPEQQ
uniref:FP protein C-terminal domain-containing protein n=1 Tax=Heliothis virescens TaxID=7102 RepID=A0A2A4J6A9_HELVI